MTERPILFSAPMVRAILDGRKTQTRRVVTPNNIRLFMGDEVGCKRPTADLLSAAFEWAQNFRRFEGVQIWDAKAFPHQAPQILTRWQGHSTFGVPGALLWVRESAWYDRQEIAAVGSMRCFFEGGHVRFANGATGQAPGHPDSYTAEVFGLNSSLKKRPGIHMPRWACRLKLRITDVRVERLKDINEIDAEAEGVERGLGLDARWRDYGVEHLNIVWQPGPRESYRTLWEHINGDGSWDANPWVWAISFERVTA